MSEEKPVEAAVFDTARILSINLRSAGGTRTVTLRFPSDVEWIERQRKRKIIIKQIGRGMSETLVSGSEDADGELVAALRIDKEGGEIDGFEATRILEQLSQADVEDVVNGTGCCDVIMRIPGGVTSHLLAIPSAKDVIQFRRAFARALDLPYGKQQLTVNLASAGELYKKLCAETRGYAGAVPIIHQVVAIKAVIDALEAGVGVAETPDF
jgi:hypothetical protein